MVVAFFNPAFVAILRNEDGRLDGKGKGRIQVFLNSKEEHHILKLLFRILEGWKGEGSNLHSNKPVGSLASLPSLATALVQYNVFETATLPE